MIGVDVDAFHLPPAVHVTERVIIGAHDGVRAFAPVLSPDDVAAVCRSLIEARARLMHVPVARVIRAVDTAARRLLEPRDPVRREALLGITALAGYSSRMAEHVLDRMAADWTTAPLSALVQAELGGADAVESFTARAEGVRARAVAPALGLHVLAGNVPGVGVTSIVRALLVRSASLVKSAAGEPLLTAIFARLLAEADPDVGACVAVTWWAGGDEELEAAALRHAGLVVHYGGAESIASLRARAPAHVRFVEHGPRISFAICRSAGTEADRRAADDLASAIATFDQQGCVSPQVAYFIGSAAAAHAFAAQVAAGLDRVQAELPRGRIDAAEAAAIRELRTRAEFGTFSGRAAELWAGTDLSHTVVLTADGTFEGTCLNRTVLIRQTASVGGVVDAVRPFGSVLQTVGVAGFEEDERSDLAMKLAGIGATRVTSIPGMPWPPVTWHHDGRGPLRELIRWVDLED